MATSMGAVQSQIVDPTTSVEYDNQIEVAANTVKEFFKEVPQVCIILGSGLNEFAEKLDNVVSLPFSSIPNMPMPSVVGHAGRFMVGDVGKRKVLCIGGRLHYYEGYPMYQLAFAARIVARCGVKILLATNAAGGAVDDLKTAGYAIAISDYLNMTRRNALDDVAGDPGFLPKGFSAKDCFSPRIKKIVLGLADKVPQLPIREGIYNWSPGPSYETPAEVRAGMRMGVRSFGMSTVPEAVAAKVSGMEFFGISVITNLAAGLSTEVLTHKAVVEVADRVAGQFRVLMCELVDKLYEEGFDHCESSGTANAHIDVPMVLDPPMDHKWEPVDVDRVYGLLAAKFRGVATALWGSKTMLKGIETEEIIEIDQDILPVNVRPAGFTISLLPGAKCVSFALPDISGLDAQATAFWMCLIARLGIESVVFVTPVGTLSAKQCPINSVVNITKTFMHDSSAYVPFGAPRHLPQNRVLLDTPNTPSVKAFCVAPPTLPCDAECAMAANLGCQVVTCGNMTGCLCCPPLGLKYAVIGLVSSVAPAVFADDTPLQPMLSVVKSLLPAATKKARTETEPMSPRAISWPLIDAQRRYLVREDTKKHRRFAQPTYDKVKATADAIRALCDAPIGETALLTNNSYKEAFKSFGTVVKRISYSVLPYLKDLGEGEILLYNIGKDKVVPVVFGLRASWNGLRVEDSTFIVRVLALLGMTHLYLLGNCYTTDESKVNKIAVFDDHVNISGVNALGGKNDARYGERFPDMGEAYSKVLSPKVLEALGASGFSATVAYDNTTGHLQHMLDLSDDVRAFGADVFAPYIIPEAVVARHHHMTTVAVAVVKNDASVPLQGTSDALNALRTLC